MRVKPFDSKTLANRSLSDRTASFAATLAVGSSFTPGLLPRKPLDQAIATGVSASVVYGIAKLTQSYIDSLSRRIAPGRDRSATESRKYLNAIANVAAIGAGVAVQKALPRRRGEPAKRASVRTIASAIAGCGVTGLAITGLQGAAEGYERRSGSRVPGAVVPIGLVLGSIAAGYRIVKIERAEPDSPPIASSLAQGALVAAGVTTISIAESFAARHVAELVRDKAPGLAAIAEPIGHSIGLGALGLGIYAAVEHVYRSAEQGGAAIESAYAQPPNSPFVSGGSHSELDWADLSREGRRFVNMVLTQEEITAVTEQPSRDPIRIFVGLDSAPTVDARVTLAMAELDRLGAFDRSVLCVNSPTGTGYINYVQAETLEFATGGDCASVGLQYSVRPSFMSLDRVKLGREQNRALLLAIYGRLMGIPLEKRPKLVIFGESLGAHTMQDAFMHEGTAGFKRSLIDHALFVGTPAESKWAEQWRLDPERFDPDDEVAELANVEEFNSLSDSKRDGAKYILLSHHEDPICKFSPELIVREPDWMAEGDSRSPALKPSAEWFPFTTFVLTLVDVKNATDVIPGKFEAWGHDYRKSIPRFTLLAYKLDMSEEVFDRMYRALETREFDWASKRIVAEQFEQAKESIKRQIDSWDVKPAQ